MSKKIQHNKPKEEPDKKPYFLPDETHRVDERQQALNALEKMKAIEREKMKAGELTKVKIPLANGVAYTTRPKEFERLIRENDFFRV